MLDNRLVVVSNRLPIVIDRLDGEAHVRASTGGLVTALSPVMERENGVWVGWLGEDAAELEESILDDFTLHHSYSLTPVSLKRQDIERYYHGFSNRTIWPLFHDLLGYCKFDLENWRAYDRVNRTFAEATARVLCPEDTIWVHDYQLMLVGAHLRSLGVKHPLSYFLHIPFPSIDLFRRLPWKNEVVRGLLQYDHLGFQTLRDRRNFIECVKSLIGEVKIKARTRYSLIHYGDRTIRAGNYPISIDFNEFSDAAATKEVAREAELFHEQFSARCLVLGIDRLDYTKGLSERFLALERALDKYPDLRGNLSLFQVVVPSRTHVPEYVDLKDELERLVGRINGRFGETILRQRRWVPIHYLYGRLNRVQLLGCYRACDIALITPLRDGMNLVAKEYCASQIGGEGVLILSEFAGTAEQLHKGSIIVNPYDREKTADAIYEAFRMGKTERKKRMASLRSEVRRNDVHQWVRWFFEPPTEKKTGEAEVESTAEAGL